MSAVGMRLSPRTGRRVEDCKSVLLRESHADGDIVKAIASWNCRTVEPARSLEAFKPEMEQGWRVWRQGHLIFCHFQAEREANSQVNVKVAAGQFPFHIWTVHTRRSIGRCVQSRV